MAFAGLVLTLPACGDTLVLILKPMPTRITAEWMAQQWRDGRRIKSKIGSYP